MRIGIDAHVLGKNIGGVERFVGELVCRLPRAASDHRYVVFVTRRHYAMLERRDDERVLYVPLASANPLVQRLVLLPWLARRHRLDALLVQRLAPWFCGRCKLVVAIHDLVPIKFASAYHGLSNALVRLLTRNTIVRAALVLVPTETIRREVLAFAGDTAVPVDAFYNGVDVSHFGSRGPCTHHERPAGTPYLLTVGAIERRKDLETLLAMLPLLADWPTMRIGLVGVVRDAGYLGVLQRRAAALGIADRLDYLGFVADAQLIALYRDAAAFVTTSLDEGFNIPPLEAMACGVPVVCSDIAVHRELFDGAAAFFATSSAPDLARAVRSVLVDPGLAEGMVEAGRRTVASYTWDAMAGRVAAAIAAAVPRKA